MAVKNASSFRNRHGWPSTDDPSYLSQCRTNHTANAVGSAEIRPNFEDGSDKGASDFAGISGTDQAAAGSACRATGVTDMRNDHDTHNRILGFLHTTMGIAMSAGLDRTVLSGLYVILGLACLSLSRK
jgi:hypothetical protein